MYGGPWMYPLSPAPYTAWCHEERGTTLEDPFERLFSLRTHAGTSESGLIGGFLGGVFGRHLIGWLTKHASDNGSKQCADNSMNAVCA